MNFAHKYVIFMKGDTVDEMAEEALHYVYIYVMRALQEHRRQGFSAESIPVQAPEVDQSKPVIKLTSFEGSKGLSAQHVFVVGVHENELPKRISDIKDLEICKFLVSLTR